MNSNIVSIITVVKNNKIYIKDAIESVLGQKYNNIEYVVIDGKSTDGTLDIIKQYSNRISKIISEDDNGIYDAMNKGIKYSTGEIIGILNSDDFYIDNTIIQLVVNAFEKYKVSSVFGNLVYVDNSDTSKITRYWKSRKYEDGLFKKGWHPPHPTFFVRRDIYEKHGVFNTEYRISADYELMLRFLEKHKITSYFIDEVLVKMRGGGESNKSIKNIINANRECYYAYKNNDMNVNIINILFKPLSKIKQILK